MSVYLFIETTVTKKINCERMKLKKINLLKKQNKNYYYNS